MTADSNSPQYAEESNLIVEMLVQETEIEFPFLSKLLCKAFPAKGIEHGDT